MEQHVLAQPERVGEPVRRDTPVFRKIAHHLRIVGGVEFKQRGIVRDDRMNEDKREVGVTVIIGRLGIDGECQYAAPARMWLGSSPCVGGEYGSKAGEDCFPASGRRTDRRGGLLIRHRKHHRKAAITAAERFASVDTVGRGLIFPGPSSMCHPSTGGARRRSVQTWS